MIKKIKVGLGILTGRVLTGPMEVSVDLTRKCNLDCLMCWWWSPLLEKCPSLEWANQEIDYELFKQLICDFKRLQVKMVILGGQGEPFLYPKLLEAVKLVKQAGMEVSIITSGFFLNQKNIKAIFDLETDYLDVSLQAATAGTYLAIHPGQNSETFNRIKEQLIFLSKLKKTHHRTKPLVQMVDTICRLNYQETAKLVELAKELGAESISFKRLDVIPQTKGLLLTEGQLKELETLLDEAERKAGQLGIRTSAASYRKYVLSGLTSGVYTRQLYREIPCYVGWRVVRVLSNGDVIPCCGCYEFILGNIHQSSFIDIWNSREYEEFRRLSINIQKSSSLFKRCKCYSCTDHNMNLAVYRRLHPIKTRRIC